MEDQGTKGSVTKPCVIASTRVEEKDNTMAMFIMAGMVVSSAGFAMYTRQADSLLKRMSRSSKIQGMPKTKIPKSKLVSRQDGNKKAKTFHEKDDFF